MSIMITPPSSAAVQSLFFESLNMFFMNGEGIAELSEAARSCTALRVCGSIRYIPYPDEAAIIMSFPLTFASIILDMCWSDDGIAGSSRSIFVKDPYSGSNVCRPADVPTQ